MVQILITELSELIILLCLKTPELYGIIVLIIVLIIVFNTDTTLYLLHRIYYLKTVIYKFYRFISDSVKMHDVRKAGLDISVGIAVTYRNSVSMSAV